MIIVGAIESAVVAKDSRAALSTGDVLEALDGEASDAMEQLAGIMVDGICGRDPWAAVKSMGRVTGEAVVNIGCVPSGAVVKRGRVEGVVVKRAARLAVVAIG